jgi:hypothetical protein
MKLNMLSRSLLLGLIPAAALQAAILVDVDPTLLTSREPTLVTATAVLGRFYTGTVPPPYRIRLTHEGVATQLLVPTSVSQTRLRFNFPPLEPGYYGFVVRAQDPGTGAWVDVYTSTPRFFKVVAEANPTQLFPVFQVTQPGLPTVQRNVQQFLDTATCSATGVISGVFTFSHHVNDGEGFCDYSWTKDFRWSGENGVRFKLDFITDNYARFSYSIPFVITLELPKTVYRGQRLQFKATSIQFPGGDTLQVAHDGRYSTDHRIWLNVPYDGLSAFDLFLSQQPTGLKVVGKLPLAPDVDLTLGHPSDFDDGDASYGGVHNRLAGSLSFANAGSRVEGTDQGLRQVWTGENSVGDLWHSGGDAISFLAAAPIPYVQQAAWALKLAGTELEQSFDLNLVCTDFFQMKPPDSYGFELSIPFSAPTNYSISVSRSFPLDLYLVSLYAYQMRAAFSFDMRLVDRVELDSWPLAYVYWQNVGNEVTTERGEFTINTTVTTLPREDWMSVYAPQLFAKAGDLGKADGDLDLMNYTVAEADAERARIAALSFIQPTPPAIIPTTGQGTFPIKPESQFPLIASLAPSVGGTITVNPPPVDGGYATGAVVTLMASAAAGYRFTGWAGDMAGSANPATVTMNDARGVTANFELMYPLVPLVNPSFEANAFTQWPGYCQANGSITGWTAEPLMGLNPVAPAGTNDFPFADNGTIPDGRQVAFLQQNGALRQIVTGLVAGGTYRVEYWENARQATYGGTNDAPILEVRMGTNVILSAHAVPPIGAYTSRQSQTFVASSDRMELAFVKLGPADLDRTVLIDNVRVVYCAPPLRIATSVGPGTLTLTWDASLTGLTLESVDSLSPPVQWAPVQGAGSGLAILPVAQTNRFYRLRSEP